MPKRGCPERRAALEGREGRERLAALEPLGVLKPLGRARWRRRRDPSGPR